MSSITSVEHERLKALIHAETQLEMIRDSIERMEDDYSPEEILEDIKMTLKVGEIDASR